MSKTINNNRQSLETNKEIINNPNNYSEKKVSYKGKSENSTNQLPINNNTTNLFITKEKEAFNNNLDISKHYRYYLLFQYEDLCY